MMNHDEPNDLIRLFSELCYMSDGLPLEILIGILQNFGVVAKCLDNNGYTIFVRIV